MTTSFLIILPVAFTIFVIASAFAFYKFRHFFSREQ